MGKFLRKSFPKASRDELIIKMRFIIIIIRFAGLIRACLTPLTNSYKGEIKLKFYIDFDLKFLIDVTSKVIFYRVETNLVENYVYELQEVNFSMF